VNWFQMSIFHIFPTCHINEVRIYIKLWVLGSLRAYKCCCYSCISSFASIFLLKCFSWQHIRFWTCCLLLELMFSTIIKHLHGTLNSPFCVLLGHVLAISWCIQLWKLVVLGKSIDMTMSIQWKLSHCCFLYVGWKDRWP
jgi:hypothetical protein